MSLTWAPGRQQTPLKGGSVQHIGPSVPLRRSTVYVQCIFLVLHLPQEYSELWNVIERNKMYFQISDSKTTFHYPVSHIPAAMLRRISTKKHKSRPNCQTDLTENSCKWAFVLSENNIPSVCAPILKHMHKTHRYNLDETSDLQHLYFYFVLMISSLKGFEQQLF